MRKFGHVQMKLFRCWLSGVKRIMRGKRVPIHCAAGNPAVLIEAINQVTSQFTGQLNLNEQVEKARAFHTVKLMQESFLDPEEEEDYTAGLKHSRPTSSTHYTLDLDFTAAKVVFAVIDKCKLFQCVSPVYKEGCQELLSTLQDLHEILLVVQGSLCLDFYKDLLELILLYASKAYAFIEKVFLQAISSSLHAHTPHAHKTNAKFSEFACRFHNHKIQLCEQYEASANDILMCWSPREPRLSHGVITYVVPIHNVARRLYKKKRVVIPLIEVNGKSVYKVELSCPRTWRSDNMRLVSRVESDERGYIQTLQADRVKIKKGQWGWEAAQDTVLITYDDLLVANVASIAGSLLTLNKEMMKHGDVDDGWPSSCSSQTFRTSIQVVGASRIDLDLQHLFIKGTKDRDSVYFKCFVTTDGEEILAVYRYNRRHSRKSEGLLHIVGRGNQPGLRHVLVAVFSSLGFTTAV